MTSHHPRRAFGAVGLLAFIAASVIPAAAHEGHVHAHKAPPADRQATQTTPGQGEPTLDEVRKATERFKDVNVALAEGYLRDPGDLCDTAEMMGKPAALGAMGIHFFRPDLLGVTAPPNPRVDGVGTHTDFLKPSILIYEPQTTDEVEQPLFRGLCYFAVAHG